MECTGATQVKKRINWPHEGVFISDGKSAVYGDPTLAVFVRGYLMVLGMEMDTRVKAYMSQHQEDVMQDTDLYRCIKVWFFHAVRLNQFEQGSSS